MISSNLLIKQHLKKLDLTFTICVLVLFIFYSVAAFKDYSNIPACSKILSIWTYVSIIPYILAVISGNIVYLVNEVDIKKLELAFIMSMLMYLILCFVGIIVAINDFDSVCRTKYYYEAYTTYLYIYTMMITYILTFFVPVVIKCVDNIHQEKEVHNYESI